MPKLDRVVRLNSGGVEYPRPAVRFRTEGGFNDQEGDVLIGWLTYDSFPVDEQTPHRPTSAQEFLTDNLSGFYYSASGDENTTLPSPSAIAQDGSRIYLLNPDGLIAIEWVIIPQTAYEGSFYGVHVIPVGMDGEPDLLLETLRTDDFNIGESDSMYLGFGSVLEVVIVTSDMMRTWAQVQEEGQTVTVLEIGGSETETTVETARITCRYEPGREQGKEILDDDDRTWQVTDSQQTDDRRFMVYSCQRSITVI